MSGKRMIDYMIAEGTAHPLSRHYFVSLKDGHSKASKEHYEKISAKVKALNLDIADKIKKESFQTIDYSNLFQSGVDHAMKLNKWWGGHDKNKFQNACPIENDERSYVKRQIRAMSEQLGAVRPPFELTWMESKIPKDKKGIPYSVECGIGTGRYADRIGWYISTAGNCVRAGLFILVERKVFGPFVIGQWEMDDRGRICSPIELGPSTEYSWMPRSVFEEFGAWATDICIPTLFYALAFLNCRNVKQAKIEPSPKLSKRWQKKTGQPLSRYHVLTVGNTRNAKQERVETYAEGSEGHRRAQHITRGHFRTYTPDKPLFGHWHGTLWIDSHVRGSKEEGIVTKSYNLV